MDKQELENRIVALTGTLYHVSYSLLRREADREDAVQTAIEKGWRKAAALRDERKLKPWLVRILINECYAILRKNKWEFPAEAPYDPTDCAEAPNAALRDGLLALPDNLRLPLMLHYMEGFSINDIASTLRCPKGTVLSRMDRGRKTLKNYLMEADRDENE